MPPTYKVTGSPTVVAVVAAVVAVPPPAVVACAGGGRRGSRGSGGSGRLSSAARRQQGKRQEYDHQHTQNQDSLHLSTPLTCCPRSDCPEAACPYRIAAPPCRDRFSIRQPPSGQSLERPELVVVLEALPDVADAARSEYQEENDRQAGQDEAQRRQRPGGSRSLPATGPSLMASCCSSLMAITP